MMSKLFDNLIWVVIAIFIVFLILLGYKATTMFKKDQTQTENTIRPYEDEEDDDLYADEIGDEKNEIDYSELENEDEGLNEEDISLEDEKASIEEEKEEDLTIEEKETAKEEPSPEPEPETSRQDEMQSKKETTPSQYSDTNYKYLVIAGSFKSKENAQNEMSKFERKGFDSELVQFTNSSLHSIAMGKYNSVSEARSLVARLKSAGIDAYMHTKRDKK